MSDCASHTLKLVNLCCKSNGLKNNVFRKPQLQPTRKQHKRVFHCNVCGRNDYLAMFCYDNIANAKGQNPRMFAHKNPWAPKVQRFAPHIWETTFSQK